MVWTDEQVDEMIFALLDSAESANWEIESMGPTLSSRGSIQIQGEKRFRAKTVEESELALEAFERMTSELFFVQHRNGIMYRVTPEGRAALKQHRNEKKVALKKWNVIGISYSKNDAECLEDWSNKYDAHVLLVGKEPAFRDNVAQIVHMFRDADVDGFVISDTETFKPATLAELYSTAKRFNFFLLAANRGDSPLTDDDVQQQNPPPTSATNHVTNVFQNVQGVVSTGNQSKFENVTVSINHSLNTLQQTDEAFAEHLKAFVQAVQQSTELSDPAKTEVLDRADIITVEASKPADKRLMHRITDNVKGIGETLKGVAALKAVWDVAERPIRTFFGF